MTVEILIQSNDEVCKAGLLADGRLMAVETESGEHRSPVGGILAGRVENVVTGINAAFVSLGEGQPGFLSARDAAPGGIAYGEDVPPINELVTEGESIVVQITRAPVADKGPRVSRQIGLAGRLAVYQPFGRGARLSRRIDDEGERDRLLDIAQALLEAPGGGLILRTAAAGADASEIEEEVHSLIAQWQQSQAGDPDDPASGVIIPAPDLLERVLRDWTDIPPAVIWIDGENALVRARALCSDKFPVLADRISRHATEPRLFEDGEIEGQIAEALAAEVELDGGGWIRFDPVEALTVIDVNSGTASNGRSPRDSALDVNNRAAREIARQLRLRNLGGSFVIDFIGLRDPRARDQIEEALKSALADDPLPTRVLGWTRMGLVEMTRRREGPALNEVWPALESDS